MTTVKFSKLPPVSRDMVMNFGDSITVLAGPVGTGKTISLGLKLLISALSIKPMEDGVRRTRFIVFRKRYGDLLASIAKDLEEIVAPGLFKMSSKQSPMYGEMKFTDTNGPVHCEVYFFAFENEVDVNKIRSQKFTCGFGPEAQEHVSRKILKTVFSRLNRFPTPEGADELSDEDLEHNTAIEWILPNGEKKQGGFLALDINYPSKHHWLYDYMVGKNPIQTDTGKRLRTIHRQPPTHIFYPGQRLEPGQKGVEGCYRGQKGSFIRNPEARPYIIHQGWGYWEALLRELMGDDAMIQQDILAEFGTSTDGLPVYPQYQPHVHLSEQELEYMPGVPVYVGADNGFNNAWIFMQRDPHTGKIHIIDEIVNVGENAKTVASAIRDDVLPYISQRLVPAGVENVTVIADQAFLQGEGGHGTTQMDILSDAGVHALPCPEKFTGPMRDLVETALRSNQILISPRCTYVDAAFSGEFKFKLNPNGVASNDPVKNEYSHPAEAAEIGITGILQPLSGRQKKRRTKRPKKYSAI